MDLQLVKKRNHLALSLRKYLLEQQNPYSLLTNYIDNIIKEYPDDSNSVQALEFLRNNINCVIIKNTSDIEMCIKNTSINIQNELIINLLLSFLNVDYTLELNIAIDNLRSELIKEINEVKNHSIELGIEFLEFKENCTNIQS